MKPIPPCLAGLAATLAALLPAASFAHDYPTLDRVRYVQECMRDHPGPHFEMTHKCVCVIDAIAQQLPYAEFEAMSTALNANSIGGERGSYIRDSESLQREIKRFRELQAKLKKACFISLDTK